MEWRILRNPPTWVASAKVGIVELMRLIKENDPQMKSLRSKGRAEKHAEVWDNH